MGLQSPQRLSMSIYQQEENDSPTNHQRPLYSAVCTPFWRHEYRQCPGPDDIHRDDKPCAAPNRGRTLTDTYWKGTRTTSIRR